MYPTQQKQYMASPKSEEKSTHILKKMQQMSFFSVTSKNNLWEKENQTWYS